MVKQNNSPDKLFVTELLHAVQKGDKKAENQLIPLVYEEMRSIARNKLRYERKNHTLDTTALVHEAYLKLVNQNNTKWQSRSHFMAIAAQAMRRILINHAEKRNTKKRGANELNVSLDDVPELSTIISDQMANDILALNDALKIMEKFNERGSRVVEYHFFGGLTWNEISEVMGVSTVTVRRAWYVSRLWLSRELCDIKPVFEINKQVFSKPSR